MKSETPTKTVGKKERTNGQSRRPKGAINIHTPEMTSDEEEKADEGAKGKISHILTLRPRLAR